MYELLCGDCIEVMKTLPANSVQCCVTSPPYYGLRDYGVDGQIGLEETPDAYVAKLVDVFSEVRRLLRDDGTLWLNLGDSYASASKGSGGPSDKQLSNTGSRFDARKFNHGVKEKDVLGIPWLVAFALRADGWWLRSEIIWHKRAPMPESVTDRPTKAHEQVFLLAKNANYFYDADAIREQGKPEGSHSRGNGFGKLHHSPYGTQSIGTLETPDAGRNKRTVWTLGPEPYSGAHFATMPTKLVEPCILAGSRVGDTVLDPFNGSGTTGAVALKHGRAYVGIDLNQDYIELAHKRILEMQPLLLGV
jgi:DNA modification methylase